MLSVQEFYVTVVRNAARPLPAAEAMDWIKELIAFPRQRVGHRLVRIAIEISERYLIAYWDGAILAAAQALGSKTVYPEDLPDGQEYAGVWVVNPFG